MLLRTATLALLCSIPGTLQAAPPPEPEGRSDFVAWWTPLVMQGAPASLRTRCAHAAPVAGTTCTAPSSVAAWCGCFVGPSAQSFDLPALLESPSLAMAAFLAARPTLLAPMQSLSKLSTDPWLMHATQETLDNSGGLVSTFAGALPGPVAELGTMADNVLQGAYHALQEQAEAEALAIAMEQGVRALCGSEALRGTWFVSTCVAARAGAFGTVAPEAGAAAFAFLQNTLREDVRGWVGPLVARVVEAHPDYASAAPAVRGMLEALVQGTSPAGALARLSADLGELPHPSSQIETLRCVTSLPAALPRAQAWVEAAGQGMAPQLDARQQHLVAFLLATSQPTCAAPAAERFKTWLAHHDALVASVSDLLSTAAPTADDLAGWQRAVAHSLAQLDTASRGLAVLLHDETLSATLSAVRPYAQLATLAAAGDAAGVYRGVLRLGTRDAQALPLPQPLVQYGGFILAMLSAEQPDEIKATLLGAGATGWRTKYQAQRRVVLSLSGLLGLVGDWTAGQPGRVQLQAALGLDAVYVVCPGFNVGAFLQLLDLGGYTTFAAEGATKPRVLQAVSPGLLVRLGILGLPLAINGGAVYDVDAGAPNGHGAWRGTVGLAVDATFWLLH